MRRIVAYSLFVRLLVSSLLAGAYLGARFCPLTQKGPTCLCDALAIQSFSAFANVEATAETPIATVTLWLSPKLIVVRSSVYARM